MRGLALAGAVVGLAEGGAVFPRIGGTSAGAIVGRSTAAYQVAGIPLGRLHDDILGLDLPTLESRGPLEGVDRPVRQGGCTPRAARASTAPTGCAPGSPIGSPRPGVSTFRDLRITTDPGTDLLPQQRYRLVTLGDRPHPPLPRAPAVGPAALPASRGRRTHPCRRRSRRSTPIRSRMRSSRPRRCRSSSSRSSRRRPRAPAPGSTAACCSTSRSPSSTARTAGTRAGRPGASGSTSAPPAVVPDRPIHGPVSEAIALLETAIGQWNRYALADEGVDARTVLVDTSGVAPTDFSIDAATRARLYANGERAAARLRRHPHPPLNAPTRVRPCGRPPTPASGSRRGRAPGSGRRPQPSAPRSARRSRGR